MRQYLTSLKCIHGIMLCPTITLSLATPLIHSLIIVTIVLVPWLENYKYLYGSLGVFNGITKHFNIC